jgi:hypothetical protein
MDPARPTRDLEEFDFVNAFVFVLLSPFDFFDGEPFSLSLFSLCRKVNVLLRGRVRFEGHELSESCRVSTGALGVVVAT